MQRHTLVIMVEDSMRILVDMDGVIVDFEKGFLEKWKKVHLDKPFIPLEERTVCKVKDQYAPELRQLVSGIYHAPGFFRELEPVPGSLEALTAMQELGIEVFICSSPLSEYRNCVLEKFEWVDQHLGKEWVKKVVLTKDKTLVRADVLVDDNPVIKGIDTPCWEHVLYDQPYNRTNTDKRRLTWKTWRSVLAV